MKKIVGIALLVLMALIFIGCPQPNDSGNGDITGNGNGNGGGETPTHIAVTDITGVIKSATVNTEASLTGTVEPDSATKKTIVWTVKDAGTTGVTTLTDANTFTAQTAGTLIVTARVKDGIAIGEDYTQNFSITVNEGFVAVTDIRNVITSAAAGTPTTLTATVEPSNATNQHITWTLVNAGTTGVTSADILDGTFNATSAGTLTVRATITNGLAVGSAAWKNFEINVREVEVESISITPKGGSHTLTFTNPNTPPTLKLTVSFNPSNATNKNITWQVIGIGNVANNTVISVSKDGLITALGAGTVNLWARSADGPAIMKEINVKGSNGHFDISESGTFQIYSAKGLQTYRERSATSDRKIPAELMNNIDMSSISDWNPIFNGGSLDGNGYTISNLTSTQGGLYGDAEGVTIQNITIANPNIRVAKEGTNVGAIARDTITGVTIENCKVVGGIVEGVFTTGGLVGSMAGSNIYGSYNTATVKGKTAGGLVGSVISGSIVASYNSGTVRGQEIAGGFIGTKSSRTIYVSGCYARTFVYCDSSPEIDSLHGAYGFISAYQPSTIKGSFWYDAGNYFDDAIYIARRFEHGPNWDITKAPTLSSLQSAATMNSMNTAIQSAVDHTGRPANVPYRFNEALEIIYIP